MLPRVLPILAIGIACLLAACGDGDASKRPQGRGNAPVPVVVAAVAEEPWTDHVRALGTVRAREAVTVTAKVSETVQRVHFQSGQEVARGAPLVTLSGQQQEAALASAQAALKEAEQLYARQSTLAGQQLIARASLDAQRATRDAARAQVAQIRANLSDRVIRAPFAGVLGIRQVSPGALVTPGTVIATLDAIDRVYVDFPLPETRLAQLSEGAALQGTVAAWPQDRFAGTVSSTEARLDPDTRALTVRGSFDNPDRKLRPGMLMTLQLLGEQRQALMVPELAVTQVGDASFVFAVGADDVARQVKVQTGLRRDGQVEVTDGLSSGDRIVVEGTGKLRDGQPVRAATTATQPAAAAPTGNAD